MTATNIFYNFVGFRYSPHHSWSFLVQKILMNGPNVYTQAMGTNEKR